MAESPKDWTRLISEVDEVKKALVIRGITEPVNADGILNRLERIKEEYGRVNAVVNALIAEMNADEPDVVVVDDGGDSSDVELILEDEEMLPIAGPFNDAILLLENHDPARGVKRPVTPTLCSLSSGHKRSSTSDKENVNGNDVPLVVLDNPKMDGIVTVPTENAALPEEFGSKTKQLDQINYLMGMFPHVEPEYLKIIVENCRGDEIQLNDFVMDALENKFRLPTKQPNRPLNGTGSETMPSCSRSVVPPMNSVGKDLQPAQGMSLPLSVPLEADSTTPYIPVDQGAVGGEGSGVLRHRDGIPGVSSSINGLNGNSNRNENEDKEKEEKDDLEKSMLYSEQLEYLIGVLPDADPTYLEDKISEFEGDAEKLKAFVTAALECPGGHRIYRTRGEIQEKQEHEAQVMKFTKNFSVEEFLEVFPDPVTHFENPNRVPDLKVREHCFAFLKGRYKSLYVNTICQVFRKENFNLSLTVKELDKDKYPKRKTKRSSIECKLPPNQCISFLQEVAYIENKHKFEELIEAKKKRRKEKFEEAKAKNELMMCNCCCDDELLSEDMSSCTDGHLFCVLCIKKGAEIIIGDGKSSFPCMHGECKAEFSLSTLQGILAPSVFGKLVMRLQAEEVNAAGIEGLETCPSCPYSTIPAPEDKVFKCLNPECMKETCRSCKEPSHIPLKCEEVEKNEEVKARIYIENKMTEALIRTCWKCNKKFIKETGCNKMTCTCGALMCYVCRQPVKDYKHFNPYKDRPSDLCPLYSDDVELHIQSVKTEAEKAKEEVMRQNPNVNLKHDPTLKLPEKPSSSKKPKQPHRNPFFIDQEENPMDLLLMNVQQYFHARLNNNNNVYDAGRQQYQPNVYGINEYVDVPQIRDYGYNIPPDYAVPPVMQVAPMPRNHAHRVPQPPNNHRVRPYAPQNVHPHPLDVNNQVVRFHINPVQPRDQPVRHHVYPPPPARHTAQNNPRR